MRIHQFVVVAFLLLIPTFTWAASQDDQALWLPRFATPAIVALDKPAEQIFTIEMRSPASAHGWSVLLSNDLKSWPGQIVSANFSKINHETEPGWQIKVRVPADISPELFDLTVSSSEGTSTQMHAVSVDPTFSTNFYVIHTSDEQIVNDTHTDPSGQYLQMAGAADELVWMQVPLNLIHPRFVIETGDQIDYNGALDGWNNWPNWGYRPGAKKRFSPDETKEIEDRLSKEYLQDHKGDRVPFVETPGNHDVTPEDKKLFGTEMLWHPTSVEFYERYFGERSWSFRMGDFYVLLHDWSDGKLEKWAQSDYARASADPSVKFKIVGQHWYGIWNGGESHPFVPKTCDLMLVGHGHQVKTMQTKPYYIYEVGPTFKYGTCGFFNFKKTGEGWICDQTQGERDVAKDVFKLFTDHGKTTTLRADQPDSMNVTTDSITITNDLPQEFYDGRVRFIRGKGTYKTAKGGTVLAEYNFDNDSKTAVLVKVDIPAKGSVAVSLE